MDYLSRTRCRTLDNGVRIFVLPLPGRTFELRCYLATGSIHEGKELGCGLSHFLEHMAFQGSRGYPGTAISDRVAELGGDVNAFTSFDHTAYRIQLESRHLETAADMLCSMVRYPELPEKRFLAERDVILRECDRSRDNPASRLFEAVRQQQFLLHPLRHPIIGYRDRIAAVTGSMARAYHDARYTPGRCFFVAVGAVEEQQLADMIEKRLGDWERGALQEIVLPEEKPRRFLPPYEFLLPDAQERLMLSCRFPDASSPELPALELLWSILGMGDGSRLGRRLVLEKAHAVDLHSFCNNFAGMTLAELSASARPGTLDHLCRELFRELKKVREEGITRAEYEQERTQQYADTLRQLENINTVADFIGISVLTAGAPGWLERHIEEIRSVPWEMVQETAKKWLSEENFLPVLQRCARPRNAAKKAVPPGTPSEHRMANGARLVHLPDDRLPLVHFSLLLPGSGVFEPAGKRGIAALACAMLSAGTARHQENALLGALDRCGADFEASASRNSLMIDFSAPRSKFSRAWELLTEMLAESSFAPEPFAREKERMLSQLATRGTHPFSAALDAASAALFGDHPYAFSSASPEAAARCTAEETRDFWHSLWNPHQTIWGFSGACSLPEAEEWSESLSARIRWREQECPMVAPPVFPEREIRRELFLPRDQAVVIRMLPGVALGLPEFEDLDLLSQAENGLGSILCKRVREDHALSYSVGFLLHGGFHRGCLAFYAQTEPASVPKVEELFQEELRRLREQGLSVREFESARESVLFNSARALENSGELLKAALLELHYGRPVDELDRRNRKLLALTPDKFNEFLRRVLVPVPGVTAVVNPVVTSNT